jgi:hypothetical protein
MMTYQLLGAVAIVVGLVGTWVAARSRGGWLLCIASTVLWLPALTTGGQWTAVGNCALSIGICVRNFLVHPARTRRPAGHARREPAGRADGVLQTSASSALSAQTTMTAVAVGAVVRVTNESWRVEEQLPPIEGPRR